MINGLPGRYLDHGTTLIGFISMGTPSVSESSSIRYFIVLYMSYRYTMVRVWAIVDAALGFQFEFNLDMEVVTVPLVHLGPPLSNIILYSGFLNAL